MFSRDFYEIVHIIGIAMLFAAMGGVAVHVANGGTKGASRTKSLVSAVHGIGALLVLTGGFGMLARMGLVNHAFPLWLWAKLVIWLVLSGAAMVPYRKPELARPFFVILPLLAGLAAWMAVYKPIS